MLPVVPHRVNVMIVWWPLLCGVAFHSFLSCDAASRCRCLPPDPCWDNVPWQTLNASVDGRLQKSVDELSACMPSDGGSISSPACDQALNRTDDEFWITAQPNGYLHTGLYNEWNITTRISEYSVLAETESDFQATIKFAHDHNLRLVVKNTGHDWYGRSAAGGSLLLWTHQLKNITWHDSFIVDGSTASNGVPAVTVGSGVQFMDLYPAAQKVGRIVMGGTCDSVGVAGCWTAGCYGPFTKKFGNGAINILQARVVLANGTLVVTNKNLYPDLFMSIRGGGGGVAAVVTEFTARSHPAPAYQSSAQFQGTAKTLNECKFLLAKAMQKQSSYVLNGTAGELCDNGGLNWDCHEDGGNVLLTCDMWEGDHMVMKAQLDDFARKINSVGGTLHGSTSSEISWKNTSYDPGYPTFPWMERHPDREISTSLLISMSKLFPAHYIATDAGAAALSDALVNISALMPPGLKKCDPFMGAKAQGGMSADLVEEFKTTAMNPVLLDSFGTWLIMFNIPELPQLPPSSRLLKTIWPRLQQYAISDPKDPLAQVCTQGAGGNESAAADCLNGWHARVPVLQEQLSKMRDILYAALPNEDSTGKPLSGSYWCETDYDMTDFQKSHWGTAYPKLLAVKDRYDPDGLFICHHCVGSERWTAESNLNCRVEEYG